MAGRLQQTRDHRADRGAATVTDVQRTGRVGRDKLHLHFAAGPGGAASIGRLLREYGIDDTEHARVAENEIDETGAGNLDPLDKRIAGQSVGEKRRYIAWCAAARLGQQHGDIRTEIAVCRVFRHFDLVVDGHLRRQCTRRLEAGKCGIDGGAQELFQSDRFQAGRTGWGGRGADSIRSRRMTHCAHG